MGMAELSFTAAILALAFAGWQAVRITSLEDRVENIKKTLAAYSKSNDSF